MDDDIVSNIRGRVARCRRLAASTTDRQVAAVLLQMADEGEADLQKLLEQAEHSAEPPAASAEQPVATPPERA